MATRVVTATEFKTKCLALIGELETQGGSITITRRGRPVAVVGPAKRQRWKSPLGALAGKGKIVGDIVHFDTTDMWECLREK
jgi:prevent-host-death family protein